MTTGTGSFDSQPHPQGRIGGSLAALRARVSDAAALEREEPAAAATASPAEATAAPRDPIQQWNEIALRTFIAVGIFSVFVNLLMLTMPIYLFQISDRVLTSRSLDTLLMLSMLALGFIAVLSLLDILRRQVLGALANRAGDDPRRPGARQRRHVSAARRRRQRCRPCAACTTCADFISSPTMLLLFDAPLAPLYFAAVFLISPQLGVIALVAGGVLIVIAVINQRATSAPLGQAGACTPQGRRARRSRWRATRRSSTPWACCNESILHWGSEQAARPDAARRRARPQLLDQRRIEVLPPRHADRRARLGRLSGAATGRSPAA